MSTAWVVGVDWASRRHRVCGDSEFAIVDGIAVDNLSFQGSTGLVMDDLARGRAVTAVAGVVDLGRLRFDNC
ncbi:hypothetical protein M0R45_016224 [Rubus argutus]|uniref:Uncharacterized protein n=1 Tax=Rubus argutus TaxID=59490 RepID=A0AAW1XRY1_RUBAR